MVFLPPLSIVQIPTKKKAAHCAMLIFNRKKAEREREKKNPQKSIIELVQRQWERMK